MLASLMALAGAICILGAVLAAGVVITQDCQTPGTPSCQDNIIDALSALMTADSGIVFWLAWVVGIFLIWGGMRLKR